MTTHTIHCAFGAIEIHSDTEFSVSEFAEYGTYEVPSTSDLSTIEKVLNTPEWDEDMLNNAIQELNDATPEAIQARSDEWAQLRHERRNDRRDQ